MRTSRVKNRPPTRMETRDAILPNYRTLSVFRSLLSFVESGSRKACNFFDDRTKSKGLKRISAFWEKVAFDHPTIDDFSILLCKIPGEIYNAYGFVIRRLLTRYNDTLK